MRIVGGTLKGRRFNAPKNIPARPTTDFAKEALFNILHHQTDWTYCNFLDLFSGIGSISLEAASRGAKSVTSVDNHFGATRWLKQISDQLELKQINPTKADAIQFLEKQTPHYELVFADPPYEYDAYERLITIALSNAVIKDGMFILEHRQSIGFEEHPNFAQNRSYGEVSFTFFKP